MRVSESDWIKVGLSGQFGGGPYAGGFAGTWLQRAGGEAGGVIVL